MHLSLNPISSAIKAGAKDVEHIVHDEIVAIQASEAKLAPIVSKLDPNLVAQFVASLSGGKISAPEALVIEQEIPVLLGAVNSAASKLQAAAK